jgi:hypothetical protein
VLLRIGWLEDSPRNADKCTKGGPSSPIWWIGVIVPCAEGGPAQAARRFEGYASGRTHACGSWGPRFRVARGIGLLVFAAVALAMFAGASLELLEHPLADVQRGMQAFRDAYCKTPYADEVRDRETLQQLFLKLNDPLAEADPEPLIRNRSRSSGRRLAPASRRGRTRRAFACR